MPAAASSPECTVHSPARDFSGFFLGYSYSEQACSSGGAIMRRSVWRSRCGACGVTRNHVPGGLGSLPYYGGPPGWQSGSDEGGESRRIKGKNPVRYSSERSRGNKSPRWSVGRRDAPRGHLRRLRKLVCGARCVPRLISAELLCAARRSAPPDHSGEKERDRHPVA